MASSTVAVRDARKSTAKHEVWPQAANVILGAWLISTSLNLEPHPRGLFISDLLSGAAIMGGSSLACLPRFRSLQWIVASVGVWLLCAPLVFWAPTASAYETNTLIGSLVIAFSIIIPGTACTQDLPGPDNPPGWTYSPSAWSQRLGIIAFALAQFFIARFMASFQLGHTSNIWDPVFGAGTRNVLHSDVSKAFPVSDAGLGGVTYLLEALTGFLGGTQRWRTMPWAVVLFGTMIVPVGIVSIVLVVLQPVAVGAWCFWCLVTAGLTVVMIGPALDELIATILFMLQARREGESLWRVFWKGGALRDAGEETPPQGKQSLLREIAGGLELLSIPWNLALSALLGLWLMAAPLLLGNAGSSANNNHLVGALVVTFAVIGFSEAGRAVRFVNLPLALWMVIAPHVLSGGTWMSYWNDMLVGVSVLALCFRRGRIAEQYGAWHRWIF
jgi:uncharacterized membrane protein